MFKYEVVAADLQSKIQSGEYKADERLPQEYELCRRYGVSRITVREAMDLLVNMGLIIKRRGAGTFVKAVSGGAQGQEGFSRSQQFNGFSKDMEGRKVSSRLHEFKLLRAPSKVAKQLQVSSAAFVCYICRTRLVDGKPYVVEYTYMPMDFITGITTQVVESSIYSYIENDLKLKIKSAHRIARASLPTEVEKRWLEIGEPLIPILEVEQIAYLVDGRIFEYSISRHRADCFELLSVTQRS